MELEIRKLYNNLIALLNQSAAPLEAQRITLELLAKQLEIKANERIKVEIAAQETIIEKGDLDNESKLD